jgi:hypothetical protein
VPPPRRGLLDSAGCDLPAGMRIASEFEGVELGDRRLSNRMAKLAEQLANAPDLSFPKASGSEAALEATYRFLNNEKVTPDAIVSGHVRATVERCSQAGTVFIAHDSTEFSFSGSPEDMGRLSSDRTHGFLGHFAMAVSGRGRAPLGVLGFSALTRKRGARRPRHGERRPLGKRESRRWLELVEQVEEATGGRCAAVHVMDREADAYELLTGLVEKKRRFVIRAQFDRMVAGDDGARIGDVLEQASVVLEREVQLSARVKRKGDPPSKARKHPPRKMRLARLLLSAAVITLRRPRQAAPSLPDTLTVNVVRVQEADPPVGADPVEWRLLTSEAIDTPDDVAAVVDAYRARWLIEEYFKALKTGCRYEERQLGSKRALLNALALFAPIGWQLLALRHLSRDHDEVPAEAVLSPLKLKILRAHKDTRAMPCSTIREAMLAIARLGGHIKNNGDPGWIVLGRGFEDLLLLELGATIAISEKM